MAIKIEFSGKYLCSNFDFGKMAQKVPNSERGRGPKVKKAFTAYRR